MAGSYCARALRGLARSRVPRPCQRGFSEGRGDRRRHQLGAAAGRRRGRRAGVAGGAAQHGDAAGPRASTSPGGSRPRRSRTPARRSASTWRSIGRPGRRRSSAIATSAVRDADNGSAFVAELRERFALSARVLDGEEEARLTYLGATSEQPPTEPTLVVDIGGGSTELIVGTGERDRLPRLAAGRRRPPQRAPHRLRPADGGRAGSPRRRRPRPDRGRRRRAPRGQGERRDRRRRHPHLAGRDRDGARALRPRRESTGTSSPSPRSSGCSRGSPRPRSPSGSNPGLHPDRAPTIVAGVVILVETMRAFGLERIEVSEHDILYGTAISAGSE